MNDVSEAITRTVAWLTAIIAFGMLAVAAVPKSHTPPEPTFEVARNLK